MKSVATIIVLFLTCLLFINADGCGENNSPEAHWRQKKIKEQKDSIKMVFAVKTLDESNLKAFEESAKLKLTEFSDYYTVFTDTTIALEFREEARKMILQLFISDECIFNFKNSSLRNVSKITLSDILSNDPLYHLRPIHFKADSIWVEKGLTILKDSAYAGELGFTENPNPSGQKVIADEKKFGAVLFNVTKQQKIFGKDTLMAWTVLLGNIRLP